jgi:acyl-CoA dehydrogenase
MDFDYSPKVQDLQQRLRAFMDEHVYPAEARFHAEVEANRRAGNAGRPLQGDRGAQAQGARRRAVEPVPARAKYGAGLTNLEYAPLCEIMGRSPCARGLQLLGARHRQHGVLVRYGTPEQQQQWLSRCSTARSARLRDDRAGGGLVGRHQHRGRIERDGDDYVINGRKWWTSGAGDPRCKILIFMGKTDPDAPRHRSSR